MKLARPSSQQPSREGSHVPQPDRQSALLLVDLQNDFFPGGALGVPQADTIIPIVNAYIRFFHANGLPIFATRDWHPPHHCSFQERNGPWPPHCVQGSLGAQFHPQLIMPPGTIVISKGTDPDRDAYSGFQGTSLAEHLEDLQIRRLYVLGLATDVCVKHTVLDARKLGFDVVVLQDATKGVNIHPDDSARALQEMADAGAMLATAKDLGIDPSSES
ncbi:MAG: bifunctional nicotinamidase/pyrazinamidase [Nitrospirae bacterium]|nr:MAG: bifunctional nicotinamidase/pyrazinamidase [Nitrospirota bacterium]